MLEQVCAETADLKDSFNKLENCCNKEAMLQAQISRLVACLQGDEGSSAHMATLSQSHWGS